MKTVNDPTATLDVPPLVREALAQLDEFTQNMPVEEMVKELHLIIERLTFHSNTTRRQRELGRQDIEALLGSDVSRSMFDFMMWSTERKILKLYVGDAGQVFLSYCAKHYRYIGEVVVTTPVVLSDVFKFDVTEQLRRIHPFPTRLIFRSEPSLIAGMVVKTPSGVFDYSFRKSMLSDIASYLRKQPAPKRAMPTVHEQQDVAPVSVAKHAVLAPSPAPVKPAQTAVASQPAAVQPTSVTPNPSMPPAPQAVASEREVVHG